MENYFHNHYGWMRLVEVWITDSGARMGQFQTIGNGGIMVNLPMVEVTRP
jgi:hypothetical protein